MLNVFRLKNLAIMELKKLVGTTVLAGGVAYVLYQAYKRQLSPPAVAEKDEEWVTVETPAESAAAAQRPQPKAADVVQAPPAGLEEAAAEAEEEQQPETPTLLTPADFSAGSSGSSEGGGSAVNDAATSADEQSRPYDWAQRVFKAADLNGDGVLSKSEIKK